ncbi:hypothetical protein EM20IM_04015 [Candidatus Methylacidiphilum infernorum]|uniref:Uncharacterized protein n=1 Tax=Candidatus Methylacidiphilum infernorum TaxID=511746 RepID=A0ABX7PXX2_9BACT|nr:hypothetical protein [Candidatus Methylacidiphilum infernorum]QSR87496.1 hypothetical protein EM20IM_04015 [Candidatus Methylacidiphilum infernorum]
MELVNEKLSGLGSIEEGLTVDGQPLGFYHFTGFDSDAHEIMAMKYAGSNIKAITSLIEWYRSVIQDDRATNTPWGYDSYTTFDNGKPITQAHRLIYRIRRDLQENFPDPFRVVKDRPCYYQWFRSRAVLEHPDIVQRDFSSSPGQDNHAKLETVISKLKARNEELLNELVELYLSKSWSITKPLRWIRRKLKI